MDLGEAELPRRTDVLDRRQRRGAGPAGMPGQVDVRRAGLGHARRDRPDAATGDELDADARARVDGPQVGDELGEVLDRVDVVVRRRADVALAGLAATQGGDVRGGLAPGQLAAFAGLRALRDLDLELVGAGQVRGRHPEPGRGDLLDPRVAAPAVGVGGVPGRVLATLAGVGRATGALDADGQRLVGLGRQGADAHRRHDEATGDGPRVLDLVERHGGGQRPDAQLVAGHGRLGHGPGERRAIAGQRGIDAVGGRAGHARVGGQRAGQDLDLLGDARREEVGLAIGPEARPARIGQLGLATGRRRRQGQGGLAAAELARTEIGQGRPAGPRRGHREARGHDLRAPGRWCR